ncbi:DUF2180 family protein [Campylobacter magnus]
MNCFYHENLGAVATCVDCGVGLCKDYVQKMKHRSISLL